MRIPSNIIQTGKYTSGNEFVEEKTNKPYQGYYYELNGSLYTGKEYNGNAIKIIKIKESNSLFNNLKTILFSAISGISSQSLSSVIIKGNPTDNDGIPHGVTLSFYSKQLNFTPILIKSVDENTYISLQRNAIYQTIYIGDYKGNIITADQAYSQMVGLKTFLEG